MFSYICNFMVCLKPMRAGGLPGGDITDEHIILGKIDFSRLNLTQEVGVCNFSDEIALPIPKSPFIAFSKCDRDQGEHHLARGWRQLFLGLRSGGLWRYQGRQIFATDALNDRREIYLLSSMRFQAISRISHLKTLNSARANRAHRIVYRCTHLHVIKHIENRFLYNDIFVIYFYLYIAILDDCNTLWYSPS